MRFDTVSVKTRKVFFKPTGNFIFLETDKSARPLGSGVNALI